MLTTYTFRSPVQTSLLNAQAWICLREILMLTYLTLLPPSIVPISVGGNAIFQLLSWKHSWFLISHISHSHEEIMLVLPSKYTQNLNTSHCFPCHHSSSSYHHLSPGSLLYPSNSVYPLVHYQSNLYLFSMLVRSCHFSVHNSPVAPHLMQRKS